MKAKIGCISDGTMRLEDLIPKFLDWLVDLDSDTGQYEGFIQEVQERMDKRDYYECGDADFDLEELFDALDQYSPEGCYFGASIGDGACYGWWECEEGV